VRSRWLGSGGLVVMVLAYGACNSSKSSSSTATPNPFLVSQGAYLVNNVCDCGGCHTSDPTKPFAGGTQFPIDAAGDYVYARNLTPDPATGLKLTEDQFIQVMQTGADFTNPGQVLYVMPWPNFRWMTTGDLQAIYAFLQVLPASSNAVPPDSKGILAGQGPVPLPTSYNEGEETRPLPIQTAVDPLGPPGEDASVPDPGHAILGAAILPLAYAKMPNFYKRSAEEQASFGRGSYLVNAALCGDCHTNKNGYPRIFTPGPNFLQIPADSYLIGGTTYTVPTSLNAVLMETRSMSQNLIGVSGYFNDPDTTYLSFASEIDAMAHTDDTPSLPLGWPMPADHLRDLNQQDLIDIGTYMQILAEDYDHTGQADKATQDPARYCMTTSDCQPGQTCFIDTDPALTVNNQCIGQSCNVDGDCNACQKCVSGACQQPAATDSCITSGI